jgi:dTDP-4-amino-4,6-dideoxygalactose transaminase
MAVIHAGAVPVFCDIDPQLHTIDHRLIEERITDRTRAVMPVHVHGLPADMDEIRTVAGRHRLAVVEDAAQAHGALYRGVRVGALGDAAGFSLNGSKHLPAGEGGLLVTNNHDASIAARRLAIFGEDTPPLPSAAHTRAYWAHGLGWNYRSHELTAAVARSQLRRLDDHIATAQRNAAILTEGIDGLPGFVPPWVPEDRSCVYYRYRIRLAAEQIGFDGPPLELRDRILCALRAEGVAADLWQLLPLPAQPALRRARYLPWQPARAAEPLVPWDPQEHPESMRLLESSIVIGTAEHPIFAQPLSIAERYVEAFEKVVEQIDFVLTADYTPIQPWPARQPPL